MPIPQWTTDNPSGKSSKWNKTQRLPSSGMAAVGFCLNRPDLQSNMFHFIKWNEISPFVLSFSQYAAMALHQKNQLL
jgi:hypothetical protein